MLVVNFGKNLETTIDSYHSSEDEKYYNQFAMDRPTIYVAVPNNHSNDEHNTVKVINILESSIHVELIAHVFELINRAK